MKNIVKIAAGSLALIHGALALGDEKTPNPSDFSVEPVGVRYLKDGKVVTDSEREENFYDFPVAQMWRENPNGTDLVMFLEPKHDNTFVYVEGRGGQVTSLVDSTGKSLLEFPGEPAVVPFKEGGMQAYFREGLEGAGGTGFEGPHSYGTIQPYFIRANFSPNKDADFVIAKGYVEAEVSTTKRTAKTSFGKIEQGSVFKSDDLEFKIMKASVTPGQKPAIQLKVDNSIAPGSTVLLTSPLVPYAYVSWRLIDGEGKIHELKHRGIGWVRNSQGVMRLGETSVMSDEPLTEGSLEVVYWSNFQKVRIPFEVKINLKKQSEEMRQYNKQIRDEYPGFFTR